MSTDRRQKPTGSAEKQPTSETSGPSDPAGVTFSNISTKPASKPRRKKADGAACTSGSETSTGDPSLRVSLEAFQFTSNGGLYTDER